MNIKICLYIANLRDLVNRVIYDKMRLGVAIRCIIGKGKVLPNFILINNTSVTIPIGRNDFLISVWNECRTVSCFRRLHTFLFRKVVNDYIG